MVEFKVDYIKNSVTVSGIGRINKEVLFNECCNAHTIIFDGIFYVENFRFLFADYYNLKQVIGFENIYCKKFNTIDIIGIFNNCDFSDSLADEMLRHFSTYRSRFHIYEQRVNDIEQSLRVEADIEMAERYNGSDEYYNIAEQYGYDDDAVESSPEYWEDIYDRCDDYLEE